MEPPSRRTSAVPARGESGLAEWADRIRSLQRQVDDDEAAEQRRLEDDIRASRLARKRRSQQGSRAPTPSTIAEPTSPRSPTRGDDEDFRDYASRQRAQADALSALNGGGGGAGAGGTSLAAFIGGRASGPRLNRHAPQADAHDPTKFEQRSAGGAPHPVFGRGGVAMHGLAGKGRSVAEPLAAAEKEADDNDGPPPSTRAYTPTGHRTSAGAALAAANVAPSPASAPAPVSPTPARERRISTSGAARQRYMAAVESSTPAPAPAPPAVRTRTLSTPMRAQAAPPAPSPSARTLQTPASAKPAPRAASPGLRTPSRPVLVANSPATSPKPAHAAAPGLARTLQPTGAPKPAPRAPSPSLQPTGAPKPVSRAPSPTAPARTLQPPNPATPARPTSASAANSPAASPASSPKPRAVSPTPALARPLQPSAPKPPPFGPRTPPSQHASAAFARAPAAKDPTPSLSRLKGRGFVASIVQKSSAMEGAPPVPPLPSSAGGGGSGGKRLSERWAGLQGAGAEEREEKEKPRAAGFRKSWTMDATAGVQPAAKAEPATERQPVSLRKSASAASLGAALRDEEMEREREEQLAREKREREERERRAAEREQRAREEREQRAREEKERAAQRAREEQRAREQQEREDQERREKEQREKDEDDEKARRRSVRKSTSARSLRHRSSAHSLAREEPAARPPSPGGRTMGSGSTMFSYIKPVRTGNGNANDGDDAAAPPRTRSGAEGTGTGKPLNHLTKDRAKRPKKKPATTPAPAPQQQPPQQQPAPRGGRVSPTPPAPAPIPAEAPKRASVADRWAGQAVLGVREAPAPTPAPPAKEERKGMVGARALPGLATAPPLKPTGAGAPPVPPKSPELARPRVPSSPVVPPKSPALQFPRVPSSPGVPLKDKDKIPDAAPVAFPSGTGSTATSGSASSGAGGGVSTPPSSGPPQRSPGRRRERIPSTGGRARVMEVAELMHARAASEAESEPPSPVVPTTPSPAPSAPHSPFGEAPPPRRDALGGLSSDRRRSSYDAFASLPALHEVKTPAPTIAMRRAPPVLEEAPPEPAQPKSEPTITIKHADGALLPVDVARLVAAREASAEDGDDAADTMTLSVEVLTVSGATATALPAADAAVFYESETLAIVHRFKQRATGLASTAVWAWRGRAAPADELGAAKLSALARRYSAPLVAIAQGAEPRALVRVLGGRLAVRQGSRQHWSAENTTMHRARALDGAGALLVLDELDLHVGALCSGFAFVLTLLGSAYVWHGRGARRAERAAARAYARELGASVGDAPVVELVEGEGDAEDELFWMMLGEREYAMADYWRWRALEGEGARDSAARAWRVEKGSFVPVESFVEEKAGAHGAVYVLDCFWELFVVVGKDARGKRADVRLGLAAAEALSRAVASDRPFAPPVHVLVLPSRVPADLRAHFRGLDETELNGGEIPDHMNLLTSREAAEHLKRTAWQPAELRDSSMLPLGICPADLP